MKRNIAWLVLSPAVAALSIIFLFWFGMWLYEFSIWIGLPKWLAGAGAYASSVAFLFLTINNLVSRRFWWEEK